MRRHGSAAPAALGFTPAALGFTLAALGFTFAGSGAAAQISRHPTGVNVNAMGATTVFITFGNLAGKIPVEAIWCGALVPASPEIGDRCDPSTIYGSLPLRYDLSRPSGIDGLTDIMSIPASVSRRAYQAAARGEASEFFYVRRFVDPEGGPDEYVTVTCRMTDGGARVPFAITEARIAFATEDPVLAVRAGERVPPLSAKIVYNGTGRLTGRWEIVRPGEEPPRPEDLLPEASLPLEQRARQRRFTEVERFDIFLPPVGEYDLAGPDPANLPTDADGEYRLLLRIEATDDKEGDTDLASALAGSGLVHTGGVAGFAMPELRYYVGGAGAVGVAATGFRTLSPGAGSTIDGLAAPAFEWAASHTALLYRIEFESADGEMLLAAIVKAPLVRYTAPRLLRERVGAETFRWRVVALGTGGRVLDRTVWAEASFPG
jgi:hypothetical protein